METITSRELNAGKVRRKKVRVKACVDGKKRQFVRRKVSLCDVWNGICREYEKACANWNEHSIKNDVASLTYDEGYIAGLAVSLHFLRHLKDKETIETVVGVPEYISLEDIQEQVMRDFDKAMEEKDNENR